MVRIEIELEERQMERLCKLASRSGQSFPDLVRQAMDRFLESRPLVSRQELVERAKRASGMFRSGPNEPTDVSTNHDEYFVQAIEDRFR